MTDFNNKIDQDFLNVLLNLSTNTEVNLGTFVSNCILKEERAINIYENKVELYLNIEKEKLENFINDLSIVVSLIETLKKDNLIFTHNNPEILKQTISTKSKNPDIYSALTCDNELEEKYRKNPDVYRKWELPTTLGNYILTYVDEFCYVRPELKEYINNGFISQTKLRFITTLRWTYVAIIIAFLGLLVAIILPFITSTTINKIQLDELKRSIEVKQILIDSLQFEQIIKSNKTNPILKDTLSIK
ncbi:hypothetical protein [Dokdonia sp. Asnod3-C12]|uniref:hypothetical protein n=1 Tax=Dokdonia sp. Asnod3-C12 TaxID=3160575 RepID=UPI00386F795A